MSIVVPVFDPTEDDAKQVERLTEYVTELLGDEPLQDALHQMACRKLGIDPDKIDQNDDATWCKLNVEATKYFKAIMVGVNKWAEALE